MIEIGTKVRLKFDITTNGMIAGDEFGPKILAYKGSIVEVLNYDRDLNSYSVVDDKNTKLYVSPYEFEEIFVIPKFIQVLPFSEGWYLYKTSFDQSPTYCKLEFRDGVLSIASGDSGYPIDKMSNFWWLKVS